MPWNELVRIGDIWLTLAGAAAIAAWLVAARAWRMVFSWSLLFGAGIALVTASKIAFIAWGTGLPALDFKAVSGHATGVTAVLPTLFYLILGGHSPPVRRAGIAAGLAFGALMGGLLVILDEHSLAEAAAGWLTGFAVSMGAIRTAGELPPVAPPYGLLCSGLVFVAAACLMRSFPFGYLMYRTAELLSGDATLHSFDSCT
ncbi:MAG: phosphatase PAP2 family protein [Telluria sp.]